MLTIKNPTINPVDLKPNTTKAEADRTLIGQAVSDKAITSQKKAVKTLSVKTLAFNTTEGNMPETKPTLIKSVQRISSHPVKLLDRDSSILSFNRRVLALAVNPDYPLLERLKFLCIVSANLDEFFEVRMASQLEALRDKDQKGPVTIKSFELVSAEAHALVDEQYHIFNHELMPALAKLGIQLLSNNERSETQKRWVASYFESDVKPLLVPVALDPSHPFPQVANKSLHFIVELGGKDAFGRHNPIAIVRVPRVLPRLVALPSKISNKQQCFVSLTSIIRAHLSDLFGGREILSYSQFRVTRHSDMAVDEDDVSNLRTALRQELVYRPYGEAIRLEVSHTCTETLAKFLLKQFDLPIQALYRVHGPVNLGRLIQLPDLVVNEEELKFHPFNPVWPRQLKAGESFFTKLKQTDVLIHQPFESFEAVLQFLSEAVHDPDVLAIHQTIYRTGSDPRMLKLLQEAVRRGKEVLAVVELKARFDEEANINWAESLEAVGAQVVYGIVGLKTHAKMLLVKRREGNVIKRYGHVSTGNYNPKTAKLYTDICMLTADNTLTHEMEHLFRHLTSQVPLPQMQKILVAPFNLHSSMLRKIRAAGIAASRGQTAKVIVKMNALTDEVLVRAIIQAAQRGAEFDLIIRGACILPVDAHGVESRIRVRSIVGRFLEHSRVFYFDVAGVQNMWLSSADWMNRNMMRRIEIAWPILDSAMQLRIYKENLQPYLDDTQEAWVMGADGVYTQTKRLQAKAGGGIQTTEVKSAQVLLIKTYS